MKNYVVDDFVAIAARLREIRGEIKCETCGDRGWVDESLGGEPTSGWAECPDCGNPDDWCRP
jgi:Zn finger protein HypA/HybF involved in hydrogenase expression